MLICPVSCSPSVQTRSARCMDWIRATGPAEGVLDTRHFGRVIYEVRSISCFSCVQCPQRALRHNRIVLLDQSLASRPRVCLCACVCASCRSPPRSSPSPTCNEKSGCWTDNQRGPRRDATRVPAPGKSKYSHNTESQTHTLSSYGTP